MIRAVLGGWLGLIAVAGGTEPWPVDAVPTVADAVGELGTNLSGLVAVDADRLWAVRDDPAELLLLTRAGTGWEQAATGWESGRALRYPDGRDGPDAEAVTTVRNDDGAVYVGAERDNAASASDESRNSILRYDTTGSGPLIATDEWELTAALPATAANTGIEGLAWIDGETLAAAGYPGHADGLFAVGLESAGAVHLVALGDGGGVQVVASFDSGLARVTELAWSRSRRELWVSCDNQCEGRAAVFTTGPPGGADGFGLSALVAGPAGLAELNNEGLALGPCVGGAGYVVWSDDAAADGHALRETALACGETASTVPPADGSTPATSTPAAATSADADSPPRSSAGDGSVPTRRIAAIGAAVAATIIGARVWWWRRRPGRRTRRRVRG